MHFFKTNWDTGVKPHIVWGAYKAVLRGLAISLSCKKRKEKMRDLQSSLKDKEMELIRKPGGKKDIEGNKNY